MTRYWKKIVLFDLLLFAFFAVALFPAISKIGDWVYTNTMGHQIKELIAELSDSSNEHESINRLKKKAPRLFYRATLFRSDGTPIFDSHLIENEADDLNKIIQTVDREMISWRSTASGLKNQFEYAAHRFLLNGVPYVLRGGYPVEPVDFYNKLLTWGILGLGLVSLFLFVILTGFLVRQLSRPIDEIIDAIAPFQEGKSTSLPRIHPLQAIQSKEFGKLALTLNSLSEQIDHQMEHLRKQKRESEGILESLGEGVVAFDSSGTIIFKNRAANKMLAIDPDLLKKGRDLILQVLQTGEPVMQTWTRGNGGKIYLELTGTPIHQQNGAVLVLQDKTSDYKVVEMGKDFVANASHELRTPITIIRGFAETLHDMPEINRESLREITERILRTSHRLEKLVKSLLTLADIEQLSEERFRTIDLVPIAQNCIQAAILAHPSSSILLELQVSKALVFGDPDLLEMALMNLIENGIKYSSLPAKIKVRLISTEEGYALEVRDCGIGIPEMDLPHIFDRFFTVDKARSRKSGGAGLGLSIFKTIIEKHEGRIEVESELNKGSAFRFYLRNCLSNQMVADPS